MQDQAVQRDANRPGHAARMEGERRQEEDWRAAGYKDFLAKARADLAAVNELKRRHGEAVEAAAAVGTQLENAQAQLNASREDLAKSMQARRGRLNLDTPGHPEFGLT